MSEFTFENLVDPIAAILDPAPPALALHALTGCIMHACSRCADPNRALLAVVAELAQLVRFCEGPEDKTAVPLLDWIRDAWQE